MYVWGEAVLGIEHRQGERIEKEQKTFRQWRAVVEENQRSQAGA